MRSRQQPWQLLFANVTSLSASVLQHLEALHSSFVGFLVVETHKLKEELSQSVSRLQRSGWLLSCAGSVPSLTSDSGNYGGAMAGVRHHLRSVPLPTFPWSSSFWESPEADIVGW